MKTLSLTLIFLVLFVWCNNSSGLALGANPISDASCEIAVPEATTVFIDYYIGDSSLKFLVNLGYRPFHVEFVAPDWQGLFLNWGRRTKEGWLGEYYSYRGSIYRRSNSRDLILAVAQEKADIDDMLSSLPRCEIAR